MLPIYCYSKNYQGSHFLPFYMFNFCSICLVVKASCSQIILYILHFAWFPIPIFKINLAISTFGNFLKALRQLVWRLLLRWKTDDDDILDWKKCPISMFSEIFSPYKHVLAALFRSLLSSLVIPSKFVLPFWNFQKLTIFYRNAKYTLAGSLKLPEISSTWFL